MDGRATDGLPYERMFAFPQAGAPPRPTVDPAILAALAERTRPVAASRTRLLPVPTPLASLLPDGGLRRGSTVGVAADEAGGALSLAVALASAASLTGSWCVVVGTSALGALVARDHTLDATRVAFVPRPGPLVLETVAALVEGVDVVILRPPAHVRDGGVRQLLARLRDRRAVLLVLTHPGWPARCDVELRVTDARWRDVGAGEDCLRERSVSVLATGRGAATHPQRAALWLPATDAAVRAV
jgi:hypothetical protein